MIYRSYFLCLLFLTVLPHFRLPIMSFLQNFYFGGWHEPQTPFGAVVFVDSLL